MALIALRRIGGDMIGVRTGTCGARAVMAGGALTHGSRSMRVIAAVPGGISACIGRLMANRAIIAAHRHVVGIGSWTPRRRIVVASATTGGTEHHGRIEAGVIDEGRGKGRQADMAAIALRAGCHVGREGGLAHGVDGIVAIRACPGACTSGRVIDGSTHRRMVHRCRSKRGIAASRMAAVALGSSRNVVGISAHAQRIVAVVATAATAGSNGTAYRRVIHLPAGKTAEARNMAGIALRSPQGGSADVLGIGRRAHRTAAVMAGVAATRHCRGCRRVIEAGAQPGGVIGGVDMAGIALAAGRDVGRRLAGRIGAVVTGAATACRRRVIGVILAQSPVEVGCGRGASMTGITRDAGRHVTGKRVQSLSLCAVVATGAFSRHGGVMHHGSGIP